MFGITERVTCEIEVKKSRFITCLIPITDKNDVKEKIEQVKKNIPELHIIVMHIFYYMIKNVVMIKSHQKQLDNLF